MGNKAALKTGEAKTLTLTITDADAVAVDLSQATLALGVKKAKTDVAYSISKDDTAFNKDQAAAGIVTVPLTATDLALAEGTYIGELKCSWVGPPEVIEKSADFFIQIKQAVT
jgi:hypothetical protein